MKWSYFSEQQVSNSMDSEFLRTQNLGIEFFQSGKRCPIFLEDDDYKRYRVLMSPKPFELRFPHIDHFKGVQICGFSDQSIYKPSNYIFKEFFPDLRRYFWPGTGLADTIFSSAQLCLGTENHNYLDVDGRLVREGNYGKMIYRNYFSDKERNFSDGLKLYLAIQLDTTNKIRQDVEEIILDFRQDDSSTLAEIVPGYRGKKTIKIFIASSHELAEERSGIERYINNENKKLNKKNIFIELLMWEDFDESVSSTRKQDDYNKVILESDMIFCLFFTKAGTFTTEEFKVAYANFLNHGKPDIYAYFKNAPVDINKISSKNLLEKEIFLEYLTEIQHYPSFYTSTTDLLLKFRSQLDFYFDKNGIL